MKRIVTASDVYNLNVDGRICIDLITMNSNEEDTVKCDCMYFGGTATGEWNLCRLNDEQIVLASSCIFKELINIELMSTNIESFNGMNCMTYDEAQDVKKELLHYKSQLNDSMSYMNTLEVVGHKHIKSDFMRLTVNEDQSPELEESEEEEISNILSSQYGVANIAPISPKTLFVKLFEEGTVMEVYRSFIGEIALIEFRMEQKNQNFFDLFGSQGIPNIVFHEE